MSITKKFDDCSLCGRNAWQQIYLGPVRQGAFGTKTAPTIVCSCDGCGIWRLAEESTFDENTYASDAYRRAMGQGIKVQDFFAAYDQASLFNIEGLGDITLREKLIADIGVGAGSFLDYVSGLAKHVIAIEPTPLYHESLKERGYSLYPYTKDALPEQRGKVDLVTSFQVIEHVPDPKVFLEEASALLQSDGLMVIATPNRNDILLKLLPDEFSSFYFRSAHRWYFDESSLKACGEAAGLDVVEVNYIHTYGLSNLLSWLRDHKPTGNSRLEGIEPQMDRHWCAYLQATGQADTIFITFRPRK